MTARPEQLLSYIHRWASPSTSPISDAVLLERYVRRRDPEAFAALLDRHGPMVLGVCRRTLGDVHDSEDAFQAVFLILARKAASIRPRRALAAWLYGVARRVAHKARAAKIRRSCQTRSLSAPPADRRGSPLDELSARELLAIFEEELQRLPRDYRLPVILCCLESRSQEEAARQLGWTPGSVKGRLERGRARLHARLVRRGLTLSAALMAVAAARGSAEAGVHALSDSTARVALRFARGPAEGSATALAEGTLRAMACGKATLLAGLLTAMMAVAGVGVLAHQKLPGNSPEPPKQAAVPPGQPGGEARPRTDRHGDPLPPGVIARLGTLRFRGVRGSLAFSPDGKLLAAATGKAGEDVTLFDTVTGREVRRIAGSATVEHLAFSPDGKRLACSAHLHCRILDVASGKELFVVEGVQGAFSGDGKKLVTADSYGTTLRVYVWDAATGRQRRQSPRERREFRQLILAVGERTFAVIESSGLGVTIRDIATGEKRQSIRNTARIRGINMPDGWTSLALTPDGKKLATVNNGGVELWDVSSGEYLGGWKGRVQSRPVFSPDGKRLAWVGFDDKGGPAQLWAVERAGATLRAVGEPVNNFEPPCFSPDGKLLAVVTDAHVISLREVASGKEVVSLDAHTRPVIDVAVSADRRQVISRGDNDIHTWETGTGKLLGRHALLPSGHEYLGPLLPGGYLLTGERTSNPLQGRFWLRDLRTGEEVLRFDGRPDVGPPTAVAAPGGRHVAVRGRAGEICVLDVAARRCVYRLDPKEAASGLKLSADGDVLVWYNRTPAGNEVHVRHQKSEKTLILRDMPKTDRWYWIFDRQPCVSPDGRWLILSTEEGRLRRWDLLSGKELSPLTEALRTTWELCWSPDGRFVAAQGSASAASVIDREACRDLRVWDVQTGTRLAHLTVPNLNGGMHVLFAHDGRTMMTTDLQGVIHLWEVATGKERGRLRGHLAYEIGSLALSADGRMLVSGGYDSQVLVWDLTGRMPDGQWRTARQPPENLRIAWEALTADDAKAAYAALWQLAADPEGTIALLRERLRPVPRPEPGQVKRLIAELDSEDFARRQRAGRDLEKLAEAAAPELRQTLERKPSLEVRRRVEALLERLNRPPAGEQLQALRAIEVLEHIGTSEARNVLQRLADGAPATRVTQEAKMALRR